MALQGDLPGVQYRRSQPRDVMQLERLMQLGDAMPDGIPTPSIFGIGTARDFAALIQTAYLSVTAIGVAESEDGDGSAASAGNAADEQVLGILILSDEAPTARRGSRQGAFHSGGGGGGGLSGDAQDTPLERTGVFTEDMYDAVAGASLENSLWLRMLVAPPSEAFRGVRAAAEAMQDPAESYTSAEMTLDLLRVAFGTLSGVEHLFVSPGGSFPCLKQIRGVVELSAQDVAPLPTSVDSPTMRARQTLLHVPRAKVLPPLTVRLGRVEDYDDTVALLVAGGTGVITELPPHFFLEEILQDQDTYNKVVVAEDTITHEVVGVACVRQLTAEEQVHLTRQYNLDAFDRLRRVSADASGAEAPADGTHACTFSIFFLYFNPAFDHSAYQLLPFLFQQFPTCDYATLRLPHTLPAPEPMVLERFQYMPLRRYQPHNARGEVVPAPDALWVCPRVSMEMDHGVQARVELLSDPRNTLLRSKVLNEYAPPAPASQAPSTRNSRPAGTGVHAVMHQQQGRNTLSGVIPGLPGTSLELLAALHEDLNPPSAPETPTADGAAAGAATAAAPPMRAPSVFALTWGAHSAAGAASVLSATTVVGLISVQPLAVSEMYALRANYDLDRFLSFNAARGHDYAATDIALSAEDGPLLYRSTELPGMVVRFAYIRPVFRHHLKFFLREVLRQTQTELLLTLTSTDAALCQTAVAALTFAPPRRVVEVSATAAAAAATAATEAGQPTRGDGARASLPFTIANMPEVNDVSQALAGRAGAEASTASKTDAAQASLALSSLFFTSRRFLGDERVRVHARVVIVGASATALCMLYELLAVPYLDYLNLTVVATDGVPLHPNQQPKRQWGADGMELLEREYVRLRLGDGLANPPAFTIGANAIRVVQGTLVDIDTSMKFIHLENSTYEPYDQLLLATGRQFVVSPPIRALQQQEAHGARGGVLALSGEVAEDRLRHALSEMSQTSRGSIANVVVYGSGLDAVAALSTMVSLGFPAQRLVLCRPSAEPSPFADKICGEAVFALFRALGVTVLDGYGVSRLEFDEDTLTSVLLASLSFERKAGDSVELPCSQIVCLEEKEIDRSVLTALAKRSIVFDGRVIVGSAYETSQPNVLAAGPVAMFTRRYGATEAFETFNPRDVGRDVAWVLLARLGVREFLGRLANTAEVQASTGDAMNVTASQRRGSSAALGASLPSISADSAPVFGKNRPTLPAYTSPVSRRVRLPCGYLYASSVCGAAAFDAARCVTLAFSATDMLSVPLDEVQPASTFSGHRDTTASGSGGVTPREMLALYVHTQHRTIDGAVYLGNGAPEVHNYRALVGLPESLFHLQYRHGEAAGTSIAPAGAGTPPAGVLTVPLRNEQFDLINYLRLPTLQPLLTDRFARFFARLQRDLQAAEEVALVRERVLATQQAAGTLTPADSAIRVAELTDAKRAFRYRVQLALLQYLHETKDTRPQEMYLPGIEKQMAAQQRLVA